MRRFTALIVAFVIALCSFSACSRRTYEDGYADGEHIGYGEGYCEGYCEGIERAKRTIDVRLEDELWELANDIEDKYGIHPEDAVQVLANHADVPDEVTEKELNAAIWAIYSYYYDSNEVMNGIKDYWID